MSSCYGNYYLTLKRDRKLPILLHLLACCQKHWICQFTTSLTYMTKHERVEWRCIACLHLQIQHGNLHQSAGKCFQVLIKYFSPWPQTCQCVIQSISLWGWGRGHRYEAWVTHPPELSHTVSVWETTIYNIINSSLNDFPYDRPFCWADDGWYRIIEAFSSLNHFPRF